MWKEGSGRVKPKPVEVGITPAQLRRLRRIARQREEYRGYASGHTEWQRGYTSNPVYKGLVGEQAACNFLNHRLGVFFEVDKELRPSGDRGYDLEIFGVKIQAKMRGRDYGCLLRRYGEGNYIVPICWDVFLSITWDGKENPAGTVALLDGWIDKDEYRDNAKITRAIRGNHFNLDVPSEYLKPVGDLIDFLKLTKELGDL
jgi:hypothetical protein